MIFFLIASKFEVENILPKTKKINSNLYQINNKQFIFITGVGKEKILKSIPLFNQQHSLSATKIINIGIAGAINKNLTKYSSYQIGTVSHNDQSIKFSEGKNLGTFIKPIWQEKDRQLALNQGAELVDMEGYFIYNLLEHKEKFNCIKFISDFCYKTSEENFQNDAKITVKEIEKFITSF